MRLREFSRASHHVSVEPLPASHAVFLSYASQDSEAARRICDSLRAAGVEVWFDQNELVGGDAWDAKIRKQIKDCALFVPIVSAATQARREGYFRLEWKLADDRTHLMARGTPFLLPVCVDDTKDWDAIVPDSFMTVQWTRLPGGETPARFCERVQALLRGEVAPARPRPASHAESATPAPAAEAPPSPRAGKNPPWLKALVATLALGALVFICWRELQKSPEAPSVAPAEIKIAPIAAAAAPAEFPRDPDLKRAHRLLYGLDTIAEDFALAEDIVKPLLVARPNDPEVVTVAAEISQEFLTRGFDLTPARRMQAQRLTERAVALTPDSPEALAALGRYLLFINAQLGRAEELLRRAIELKPNEPRYHRTLFYILTFAKPTTAEGDAFGAQMAAKFPSDPLVTYDIARRYKDKDDLGPMEQWFDRSIALVPLGSALVWKAWIALEIHGDLAGMKSWLDRVPDRLRTSTRVVNAFYVHAMFSGETTTALQQLNALGDSWMTDFDFTGPKALLVGDLLRLNGLEDLARLQYEIALAEVQRVLARDPTDWRPRRAEMLAFLALGRRDEARADLRLVVQALGRPYRWSFNNSWTNGALRAAFLMDERELALTLLKETAVEPQTRAILRNLFRLDPRMAPFRDDKEIIALLAEPKKEIVAAPALSLSNGPLTDAAKLVARAVTLYSKINYTRDDLAIAEDLARKATELEPDSAAAWGARAGVHATYLSRNWDVSEKRRLDLQTMASRALGLNPDDPEGLLALGRLLTTQGRTVWPQAEAALKRAFAARPEDNRFARALGFFYGATGRVEEERRVLREVLQRDARDPLVLYDLAMSYANYGTNGATPASVTTAIEQLDAGIAVQPLGSLLLLKAALAAGWRGDLPTMRVQLDRLEKLPLSERTEDRAIFIAMWGGLLERKPALVVAAGALTAKNYFEDTVVPRRSKDWTLALAHLIDGKENLARFDWQKAESVLRQRRRDDPNNQTYVVELATTLAWLGRSDEAAREVAPIEAAWREELTFARARALAFYHAAAGDATKAAPYLRRALNSTAFTAVPAVRLDPWWDKIRGAPEFEALLKEAEAKK